MLSGPPGAAKTDLIGQCAERTRRDLFLSLPALEDTTEPGGLPWFANDHSHAEKLLFGQAWRVVNSTRPCIWCLEDFGMAFESVQKGYIQWCLAREVNGHRLPDHVSIVATTNRRSDRAGISGILEPVKGRFTIINIEPNVDDFVANLLDRGHSYGLDDDQIIAGSSFIQMRRELLNAFNPQVDIENSPTPRNWVAAFKVPMMGLSKPAQFACIAGRVGEGAAAEYTAHLQVMNDMPSLDSILHDPKNAIIPPNVSARWAVSVGLARVSTEANFGKIAIYIGRMEKAGLAEFAVLLARDAMRQNPRIQNTKAWIDLTVNTETGRMIRGV